MGTFRIDENEWNAYLANEFKEPNLGSIETQLQTVNSMIKNINARINAVDKMEGITYHDQAGAITKTIDHIGAFEQYINQTIGDVEDLLDNPFYEELNHERGAIEELELIADKKYTTKNTLGIQEHASYNVYSTNTSNASMSGQVVSTSVKLHTKEMIGFEDILKMKQKNGEIYTNFSKLYHDSYELKKAEMKQTGGVKLTYDEYVRKLVEGGAFEHSVDKGWKNWASTALDTIGIVSFVSKFTGNDFITGERYTSKEKEAASLNIAISLSAFVSFGISKGAQLSGKIVLGYITSEMAAGITARVTVTMMDEMGAPRWLQNLTGVTAALITGTKVEGLLNSGIKSIDDIVKVGITNIDDIKRFGITNIEELKQIGIRNIDDLIEIGVKDAEGLARIGITNAEDLAKLGITSAEDYAKLGIKYGNGVIKGASGAKKTLSSIDAEEHAFKAIKGSNKADDVVLGKFKEGSSASYDAIAKDMDAQYFNLDNWDELSSMYSSDEIWKINQKFLDIQTSSGREIYLSHNPAKFLGDGSYYSKEIQYLIDNGYKFIKEGDIWHAIR